MTKYASFAISLAAAHCLLIAQAATAFACSASPLSPDQLLTKSDVIVRATAINYRRMPDGPYHTTGIPDSPIEFRVEEVLKGEDVPLTLVINGYLSDKDDFNDRPVPYNFVRGSGRRGSCYANDYKEGAPFLLFLTKSEAGLTPYWAALTPTNEQLSGADDEWLSWVRGHVDAAGKRDAEQIGVADVFRMNAVRASPPKSFRRIGTAKPTAKSVADWQYWVSQGHRLQLAQAYRKLTKHLGSAAWQHRGRFLVVETYTDRAKRVIAQAHQEAIQQGVTTVTPEHLLLSLLHEEPSLLSRLLAWRISPGSIRQQIEEYTDRPEAARSSPALTFSDESQQVLAYAGEEAARRMWPQVGPEHLVLGLLREERSVAAKVLYESGLRLTCVRDEVGYQE